MSSKDIKTIFFDIGGVLINIHPDRTYQYLSDSADIEKKHIVDNFPIKAHHSYEKGLINNNDWFLAVKESMPQPCCLKKADFWRAWKLLLGEEKRTIDIIERLRSKYLIWLISNTNPKHIKDDLDKSYIFPQLVHGATYSFEVGSRKPEREIYKIAMQLAGVEHANQSIFIDDLNENIITANSLGMNGIHYRSHKELEIELLNLGISI